MKHSILIPVFNKKDLTLQCLQALKDTVSADETEVIVVDNASTDGSVQAVRAWSQESGFPVQLIQNPVNMNFAHANNQAALAAKGKTLIFLNNDTIPLSGWLEALVKPLLLNPEIAMSGARLLYGNRTIQHAGIFFVKGVPEHRFRNKPENEPEALVSGLVDGVTAACSAMRRSDFLQLGGFDEGFINGYEDVDLCFRTLAAGFKIWYAADSVVFHLESQTPGRNTHGLLNWTLLNTRWAGLIPFEAGFQWPGEPVVFKPSISLLLPHAAAHASSPRKASGPERLELMKWFAQFYDGKLATVLAERLVQEKEEVFGWELLQATLHLKNNNSAEARKSLTKFLKNNPNNREAELRLGEVLVHEQQFEKAVQVFERVLHREPENRLLFETLERIKNTVGLKTDPFLWEPGEENPVILTGHPPVFSIVMLTFNQWHHTEKCLKSLESYSDRPFELILVDNASTDGTAERLRAYVDKNPQHTLILNRTNKGFPAGNNLGFGLASGKFIVWLNNDTIVSPAWLSRMENIFEKHPGISLLGPVSNMVTGAQQIFNALYKNRLEFESFCEKRFQSHAGKVVELKRVIGFCLAMKKEVLEVLGGLDENFGRGNFEDDDYCVRAGQHGFRIGMAPGIFIHHTGNQSFRAISDDYSALLNRNFAYFREKWGIPGTGETGSYAFTSISTQRFGEKVKLPDLAASHQRIRMNIWQEN